MQQRLIRFLLATLLCVPLTAGGSNELQLPTLGDTSSGMISHRQEYQLGREWLRLYRSQVPTSSDAQIQLYTEQLLNKLAQHSELNNPDLEVVVTVNSSINAFAVPGGVVGIHTGLLTAAENEHQFASVLAHELAHLSQRHYARRLEQQRNMALPFYTALLGSLVLAATTGSDAGIAAIMSTQAAAHDAQLRFSRQNEQEADRIGFQTMVRAGMDPYASANMFDLMLRQSRYSRRPPEFLLSHPVTESRISDARNRAMRYPRDEFEEDVEYHLMRARARLLHQDSPQMAVRRFQSELEGERLSAEGSRYGLSLAHLRAGHPERAMEALEPLLAQDPDRLTYQLLKAEIQLEAGEEDEALALLNRLHENDNRHHAINMVYADALMRAGKHEESTRILERHSRVRSDDPHVWYLLAEVSGLAGDILQVHRARAEYFIAMGAYPQAMAQLRNAQRHTRDSDYLAALINERMRNVEDMQRSSRFR
ncbi:M48 family metalloprotease [Marinimicrobium alkaliphilum]|uniref:M48 family metalloprotease n=1 Tax=Marinimicrobium alkaliphilum TaxID=2202654 RepID=UPI000DBAB3DE|nr:M48 family metalloprotease [Marinimicrobium alkaliphilum]